MGGMNMKRIIVLLGMLVIVQLSIGANGCDFKNNGEITNIWMNGGDDTSSGSSLPTPKAPSGVTAQTASSSDISLSWKDDSDNEDGFKIERRTGAGGTYALVAVVGANVVTYTNRSLVDNTTYYYIIRAYNSSGDSVYSNEACATTFSQSTPPPPPPITPVVQTPNVPSGLMATAVSSSQINLSWTDNSNNESGFRVERKVGANGTYILCLNRPGDTTTYSDTYLSPSTTYYYRVRSYNSGGDSAYSNETSATTLTDSPPTTTSIISSIVIPSLNDEWIVGNINQVITWMTTTMVNPVDIYYSVKGDWTDTKPLALSVAGGNGVCHYALPSVPDDVSSGYTVKTRICDANNHNSYKDSQGFKIKGALTVIYPACCPTDIFRAGNKINIQWTSNASSLKNVKLYYVNGAMHYITARPSVKGTNSYEWTIPAESVSDNVKIRVEDANDSTVYADGQCFKVKPQIKLTVPGFCGGEIYKVGNPLTVSWVYTGTLPTTVNLEYDKNDADWRPLPHALSGSYGQGPSIGYTTLSGTNWYSFVIPDEMLNPFIRIRIVPQADTGIQSVCSTTFKVIGDFVNIHLESGGIPVAIINPNQMVKIDWTKVGPVSNVYLQYSDDDFISHNWEITPCALANTESYIWAVPNKPNPNYIYKIRIIDASDSTVSSTQAAAFKISGGGAENFRFDYPLMGTSCIVGQNKSVTWTTLTNITRVNLHWSVNGIDWHNFDSPITGIANNPGEYTSATLIVPNIPATSTFTVRVQDYNNPAVWLPCSSPVTVKGKITVTRPDSNTVWYIGDSEPISWTVTGIIDNVKLDYWDMTRNGGIGEWVEITSTTPAKTLGNQGGYMLTSVPDLNRDDIKIRVRQIGVDPSLRAEDESVAFKIRPKVIPNQPLTTSTGWASVAASHYHNLAIKADGTLWAWGNNTFGELGVGDFLAKHVPTRVGSDSGWVNVTAGENQSLAIKGDGTLWAWGRNGILGFNDTANRCVPTQVGTDKNWLGSTIVTSGYIKLVIKSDGTLWAWGSNGFGQLGLGDKDNRGIPAQVGTDTDWKEIILKPYESTHVIAKKTDGSIWAWGDNRCGQLGLGDKIDRYNPTRVGIDTDWDKVVVGSNYTIAKKTNGTLWAWGSDANGRLGLGNIVESLNPKQIGADDDWEKITSGGYYTIAIKTNGTLWSWGSNWSGWLGVGDTVARSIPTQVGIDSSWGNADIYAVYGSSVSLKADGTIWAWGLNGCGQLGLGDTTDRTVPTQVK
jgi:alpha-tubulin suppressor-like RCC1 family protein